MHFCLIFSKIESEILYLKNYYQKSGLQIFKTQKMGLFFRKPILQKAHAKKKMKDSISCAIISSIEIK